ncbi:MAG TPA: hypothetical protein VFO46_02415 [Candidatus Sulfotelmatobacter sp.]|nr:hypothetical protein [Candidatus Sulfotelmatobacter sp.]
MPRYEVVPPVPDGYAWWTILEPAAKREVAIISIDMPNAEQIVRELTERLNQSVDQ